jgi:hypothetical protein
VKSDGTIDNLMTEFVKIISSKKVRDGSDIIWENEYESYTTEEFVKFSSRKNIIENQPNEYKMIPIVYKTRDCVTLMPEPDEDTFNMVTLLPLILTDLNFAIKYQCFSIFYTVNCKAKNMTISPNAVWNFESTGQDGDKPELGMLSPSAKVEDVLKAIRAEYTMWLEEKGLKLDSLNQTSEQISGIAKAIDMADVTNDINYQRGIFVEAEKELLKLYGLMTTGREWEVDVGFETQSIFEETPSEKVERITKKLTFGLISKQRAIEEANAHMSKEAIDEMKKDIEKESVVDNGQVRSGDNSSREGQNGNAV